MKKLVTVGFWSLGPVYTSPEILYPEIFLCGYGLRPHESTVSDECIRRFLYTLSRVKTFVYAVSLETCGRCIRRLLYILTSQNQNQSCKNLKYRSIWFERTPKSMFSMVLDILYSNFTFRNNITSLPIHTIELSFVFFCAFRPVCDMFYEFFEDTTLK